MTCKQGSHVDWIRSSQTNLSTRASVVGEAVGNVVHVAAKEFSQVRSRFSLRILTWRRPGVAQRCQVTQQNSTFDELERAVTFVFSYRGL